MSEQTAANKPTPKRRRFRIIRILGISAIVLAVLIVVAPGIVARTGLRDTAINAILASPRVSTRGSVGLDETLDLLVELPRLRKDKLDKGPLQCQITGSIKEPKIAIKDAPLAIKLKGGDKAALTVDNVNLNFRIEDSKGGRTLTLAPVTIFEKQKLTPEVADQLIHLIVPTLTDLGSIKEPKIAIKDAPLAIKLKGGDKAALTVDNVNLNFRIEDSKGGRTLTLAPVTIFECRLL
jgi:hypothetical protein